MASSPEVNNVCRRKPDFYLASSEGYGLETPRKAYRVARLKADYRDDLLLIRIDPPLPGGQYDRQRDIDLVVVAVRHAGASLFPIATWPVFVHVALPVGETPLPGRVLSEGDLVSVAWAELYPTEEAALKKDLHPQG